MLVRCEGRFCGVCGEEEREEDGELRRMSVVESERAFGVLDCRPVETGSRKVPRMVRAKQTRDSRFRR